MWVQQMEVDGICCDADGLGWTALTADCWVEKVWGQSGVLGPLYVLLTIALPLPAETHQGEQWRLRLLHCLLCSHAVVLGNHELLQEEQVLQPQCVTHSPWRKYMSSSLV